MLFGKNTRSLYERYAENPGNMQKRVWRGASKWGEVSLLICKWSRRICEETKSDEVFPRFSSVAVSGQMAALVVCHIEPLTETK